MDKLHLMDVYGTLEPIVTECTSKHTWSMCENIPHWAAKQYHQISKTQCHMDHIVSPIKLGTSNQNDKIRKHALLNNLKNKKLMKMLHIKTCRMQVNQLWKEMYNLQICLWERMKLKEPSRWLNKLEKGTTGCVQRSRRKKVMKFRN